jgi:hypothetical protein
MLHNDGCMVIWCMVDWIEHKTEWLGKGHNCYNIKHNCLDETKFTKFRSKEFVQIFEKLQCQITKAY